MSGLTSYASSIITERYMTVLVIIAKIIPLGMDFFAFFKPVELARPVAKPDNAGKNMLKI